MHACRCAHALDVVPSDETTLSKLPLLYRGYMHSSLTRANFTNMIPWYGRLSQRPLLCIGANHSYQHINTGGKKAVQHTLWSINLQDREIDEHTTAYAPTREKGYWTRGISICSGVRHNQKGLQG